jgi:hypothetical protein
VGDSLAQGWANETLVGHPQAMNENGLDKLHYLFSHYPYNDEGGANLNEFISNY